jgi:malate synthase
MQLNYISTGFTNKNKKRKSMKNKILSYEAKIFLDKLSQKFSNKIEELLESRNKDKGNYPGFLHETPVTEFGKDWKVLPPPEDIQDRRVEITGPPVRKMIINAMNSGANVYMCDFEDSNCPTFENCIEGQSNLIDAVNGTINYRDPKNGKSYKLNKNPATLFVRPRGIHLLEKNYLNSKNKPIEASLFDFGLYFFHNAKSLYKSGKRPYFYLPKIEHYKEARLWNDIFNFSEKEFDLPIGTIRATVLIETLPAAFQMDEILFELRMHSAGLNCGRWDYIFSFIKSLSHDGGYILPDRDQVGMNQHLMRSYSQLLIQTCHRRGAHAMGGMAAQIPIKGDNERNAAAMAKVRADKIREVQDGHDGTWVAHPGLVEVAKEIFDEHMPEPNQIDRQLFTNKLITKKDLLTVPVGTCTEEGLRKNINVGFQYINSWINGNGCVPINNLMEDAATAEISRAQIWQWQKYKTWLSNGKQVTRDFLIETIEDEIGKFEGKERFEDTREVLYNVCMSKEFIDFLTLDCYDLL